MVASVSTPMLVEVVKEPQPEFKLHPMNIREIDMTGALSFVPSDVLLVEYIHSFIHCKLEELGVKFSQDEFKRFCDNDFVEGITYSSEDQGFVICC